MSRHAVPIIVLAATLAACGEQATSPTHRAAASSAAKTVRQTDPTATWLIPLDDAGLGFRSDHAKSNGTYSVYTDGVCGVSAKIFATTASSNTPSGDATIQTSGVGKCGRSFALAYPDGTSETLPSFNNLNHIENPTYSIPIGTTVLGRLVINPGVLNDNPSRCDKLDFGPFALDPSIGAGSDDILITRVDARTWHVQSQPAPDDLALCEKTGELLEMRVDFTVVASRDLP